ncbi:MAG: carboxypeptidase regulatory-like domain-containing protein [bacterium]|nr:carboxypeptidase regulatory-like domain-containing protein [bacterium]
MGYLKWFLWSCVVLIILLLVSCVGWAPSLEGTIIDAHSGAPLADVQVVRWVHRPPPFRFGDTTTEQPIGGSRRTDKTDVEGRFRIGGGLYLRPTETVLSVFKASWMPIQYCVNVKTIVGSFSQESTCATWGTRGDDPWRDVQRTSSGLVEAVTIRLQAPDSEEVANQPMEPVYELMQLDPWLEYFVRLDVLVSRELVQADVFVDEVVGYLSRPNALTESILRRIESRVLPYVNCADPSQRDPSYNDPRIRAAVANVVQFCRANPDVDYCQQRLEYIGGLEECLSQFQISELRDTD